MIKTTDLIKSYRTKGGLVAALDGVSIEIPTGQFVSITGPSGCGKSTLMMMLGGMLAPTGGCVQIEGDDLYAMPGRALARFRAKRIGFVFQLFHLVPYLSVLDNVLLGARNNGVDRSGAKQYLEKLGLGDRAAHKPEELSVGQRQRAAIARAMLNRPQIILADEPTGNLDPENEADVFGILKEFHRDGGTVIVVSHGDAVDRHAQRAIRMNNGRVIEDVALQSNTNETRTNASHQTLE